PVVRRRDPRLDLADQGRASVAVRHDDNAEAFSYVCEQIARKAPVASAMREIPSLIPFFYSQANPKRTDTYRRHHLARHRLLQDASGRSTCRTLNLNGKTGEIARR